MAPLTPSMKGRVVAYGLGPGTPKSMHWISKTLGIPRTTVRRIIQHAKDRGNVYALPRSGRPQKLDARGEARLIRTIHNDPKSKFDVFGEVVGISRWTASRIAKKHGLNSRIARKKPMIPPVNQKKRVQWARDNEETDWKRVMFTDESCFKVGETARERVLPLYRFKLAKARKVNGQTIAAETINSQVYSDQILWGILQDYVVGERARGVDVLVVEDGAPVHFGGASKAIRPMLDIPHQSHPPSSPDLNPIEGCWRIVKQRLRGMDKRPTSVDELWTEIERIWAEIPQETIDGMIISMAERRNVILEVDGKQTRW
ncbi:hypothetical protein P7C73_g290, partial [Tremellales sp. Uapishka_1]